jgi:hypothetical protein
MTATPESAPRAPRRGWLASLVMWSALWPLGSALAQPAPPAPIAVPVMEAAAIRPLPATGQDGQSTTNSIGFAEGEPRSAPLAEPLLRPLTATPIPAEAPAPASAPIGGLAQAGCASCGQGGGLLSGPAMLPDAPPMGCDGGCTYGTCYPGRQQCDPCLAQTCVGRFFCGLYECICCPDPCYDPKWLAVADAAFFVDSARPQTQERLRYDAGLNLILPDRSEYFWARADGKGKGPTPQGSFFVVPRLRYNDLSLYTEAGTGTTAAIVEIPYREIDPDQGTHAAGFGDMMVGVKTLMFDCELIQLAFEMKTYLPAGNAPKGLGTGHISLEPTFLVGLKLAQDTYVQSQLSEWVPLGGDPSYQGSILMFNASLNQVLFRVLPTVPLLGTMELNTWAFQHGSYTDPLLGSFQKSSGEVYVAPGAGLRLVVCDKFDIGFGAYFSITQQHFAEQFYRTEVRFRF